MNIGFIGLGNMSSAIIKGCNNKDVSIFGYDIENKSNIENVAILASISELVKHSDVIFLGIKPNVYPLILKEISSYKDIEKKVVISMTIGLTIEYMSSFFNTTQPIIRIMPNTPIAVKSGVTALSSNNEAKNNINYTSIVKFLEVGSYISFLDEKLIDYTPAISGSSPAYVYIMIEAMADEAVSRGIPRDEAYKLASNAVKGACKMVNETNLHPGKLKDNVCSPGGSTIAAVKKLEQNGFRSTVISAMEECTNKVIEYKNSIK